MTDAAPAPEKLSKASIFSLILGILVCIPFSGLLAVILGIVGFLRTREPGVKGRGFAIAGGLLGLGNIVTQIVLVAVFGVGLIYMIMGTNTPQGSTDRFIKDIAAGNIQQIMDRSPGWDRKDLDDWYDIFRDEGAYESTTYDVVSNTDATHCHLEGTAKFSKGTLHIKSDVEKANGKWDVMRFSTRG